ncbi:MAG: helix-turn-helix domain-containing protein [Actinomycetes bacterium]
MTTESHESPEPTPTSIGSSVSEARQASGLSIADVSERTRIRKTVIEEIERDDFTHCGGNVYAKGHLRSIGSAVGADPAPWVAEFERQYGTPPPTATEVFDSETSKPVRIRRGVNWSAIMAVALVIAVGLVVVQVTRSSDDPTREPTTVASPEPTPTDTPSAEPSQDQNEVAQADQQQVVVRMNALPGELSWVSVTRSDGSVIYEGDISNGQSKTFRDDKKISVLSGCASSIELTVNGQDVGSPGATCGPVKVNFTPKDPDGAAG